MGKCIFCARKYVHRKWCPLGNWKPTHSKTSKEDKVWVRKLKQSVGGALKPAEMPN